MYVNKYIAIKYKNTGSLQILEGTGREKKKKCFSSVYKGKICQIAVNHKVLTKSFLKPGKIKHFKQIIKIKIVSFTLISSMLLNLVLLESSFSTSSGVK